MSEPKPKEPILSLTLEDRERAPWSGLWDAYESDDGMMVPFLSRRDMSAGPVALEIGDVVITIDEHQSFIALHADGSLSAAGCGTLSVRPLDEPEEPRIARAPAGRLVSVLSFVLTRSAYERIIAPYIAQEQHEHYEALVRKEYGRANFIVARMYVMTVFIGIRALLAPLFRLFAR